MDNMTKIENTGEFWPHEIEEIEKKIHEEIEENKKILESSEIIEALKNYKKIMLNIFQEIQENQITNELLLMIKYLEQAIINQEDTQAEEKLLIGELRKIKQQEENTNHEEIIKKIKKIKQKLKKKKD